MTDVPMMFLKPVSSLCFVHGTNVFYQLISSICFDSYVEQIVYTVSCQTAN